MRLHGKLSLTLFVSLSCAAMALVAVLVYSALSMEFFRMGIESIHEAQLKVALHDAAGARAGTEAQADDGMNRIHVTADAAALPTELRRLLAEEPESGYRTVIIEHGDRVEGIY